ncbi:16S rRNA (guanine(527)-N(7))-methyltransferase RsmG [Acidocella sp.]|uniref:16S rRNA (guanine(527)-N(7))-methyltransferase RsmG n=1 Tax=Acidocella sp. TaxID=50710 RepID=UPI002634CC14|nr:16S rRNA (guanine(527)-N(7))-methyltransferase RsmG [Acidocella sp.]
MTEPKLRLFADLVAKWSPRINLISKSDLPHLWERHIQDSLRLLPFLPPDLERAIDLGSGAGFPGLVLCIQTNIPFDLVESDARKAAFLLEAARQTGAPAKIHNCRIEAAKLAPARLVTARALAPLDKLLGLAAPLLTQDGFCLFPKGRTAADELTAAARLWHMNHERLASSDDASCILKLSEIRHAGPT